MNYSKILEKRIKDGFWMLIEFIYFEIKFAFNNIYYTAIKIAKGIFRVMIYLGIIYFLLSIYGLEDVKNYINSQKVIGYFNNNNGAIQALSTTILVILTAWYANITHKMLILESRKYSFEYDKYIKEFIEKEDKERKRKYNENEHHIGIKKR